MDSKINKAGEDWATEIESWNICTGFTMGQQLSVRFTLSIWIKISSAICARKRAI